LVSRELKKVMLSAAERAQLCKQLSPVLGVRASLLEEIQEEVTEPTGAQERTQNWDPWPEPVNGEAWLDEVFSMIVKHFIISEHKAVAAALYTLLTNCTEFLYKFPTLHITAGTKNSGKTDLAIMLGKMAYYAEMSSDASPASIYYTLAQGICTWVVDEIDVDSKSDSHELLMRLLNGSYTRETASVRRVNLDKNTAVKYSTFSPKIVAGNGLLKDATESRAIKLVMTRKRQDEIIADFRKVPFETWERIARKGVRWALDNGHWIGSLEPSKLAIPEEVLNRSQDNWFPLMAIAYLSGERWHKKAITACIELALDEVPDDDGGEDATAVAEKLVRDLARVCLEQKPQEAIYGKDSDRLESFYPTKE
jgi:hypothetical protein